MLPEKKFKELIVSKKSLIFRHNSQRSHMLANASAVERNAPYTAQFKERGSVGAIMEGK